ncbi:aminoacyl-tRNA hydrolase [Deinococcus metallilatus]|uniref:Peptidyl-tRNA hydrolase n=1 Tax=Deinococcus metallilatus TaxID=1211322 RepID=A0AAJ5JXR0_9DEIO|nr:aminoacyl-tRNA hydrolase [Deinococcus metallilatus]MBB5296194.1 PTH1 family peptidyl-tRNA hydrolase [Deinococcus metallilatus]QBY09758.1 aminoacyl-tRNA hydrolase [Deinococcus metallilatus]RXJ08956.1 aminoacyl-tRNA hydrolase [Deinococcus metallilatus]TLK23665.1 aminoacyl-tRNA hydrolase [Deinococcus metallilatus]GMA14060.1 peptidyl-tRNA hydrolase [Deinococcus metallilatus]
MKLVVGLGNPGSQYAQTRHNVGWLVVDEVARRWGAVWRKEKDAEVAEVRVGSAAGAKVLLVKPQTFMNASGKAVGPLLAFYKLGGDALLVVQDDLDSPFGLLKFRLGGRHGGQNGVRDIIRVLGTPDFPRLKIGISRPPAGWDPADWVLSRWRAEEVGTLAELVRLGADAVEVWAQAGLAEGQARFNGTDLRPKPEPAPQPEPGAAGAAYAGPRDHH